MSQFFTNEAVSLEKSVDSVIDAPTELELIDDTYELKRCVDWIKENNFKKVCLQFPDHLLPDSASVALKLQKLLNQNVYILGDTAYESCCIDYVAAAHITADAIIHFGPVCFSKTSANIPYLYIYEKKPLDLDSLQSCLNDKFQNGNNNLIILLDTPFIYLKSKLEEKLNFFSVQTIDSQDLNLENSTIVFIGGRNFNRKLPNLKFSYKPQTLYYFDNNSLINYDLDQRVLKRRYFLVEKIKDSNTVAVVIGTLGVKNYLQVIERLKNLLTLHKKKYYLISVGKPTVAKLANFPEVDIYVVVTCALNEIYDSRDYYKPIVTPFDVELALNPHPDGLNFTYDYNDIISRSISDVRDNSDVSLVTGNIRGGSNVSSGSDLVSKEAGTVALNTAYGAGYLATRDWKGLERNLGKNDVKIAEEGRHGIAQCYTNEKS